jgi:hypothetical protein
VRRALGIVAIVCALGRVAAAQDAFEIQVYDAETAPPAAVGLETHVNYVASGVKTSVDGELPSDRVAHLTFEPHLGLRPWCEVGAYFQTALRPDGAYQFAGVKVRFKARVPRRLGRGGLVGLAVNAEFAAIPPTYEASGYGGEVRPIIDLEWRRLYVSVNPILSFDFRGPDAGHPQMEPAAQVLVALDKRWQMGVEYYAALGPIDRPVAASAQVHRLFAVAQVGYKWFGLNIGGGYGLAAGDKWIAKAILSFGQ